VGATENKFAAIAAMLGMIGINMADRDRTHGGSALVFLPANGKTQKRIDQIEMPQRSSAVLSFPS
jgi:hypothetical protein